MANKKKVTLRDLEEWPIALPTPSVQARKLFDKELNAHPEIKLRVRIELNDANFLINLVEQGTRLVTILSKGIATHHDSVVAIPLDIPNNELIGGVHVLHDQYRKHSANVFVEMLRNSPVVRLMQ